MIAALGLPVRRRPMLAIGTALLLAFLLAALLAPWIAPFDPIAQDGSIRLQPPSLAHPFGTDNFGRDVLSRVIWAPGSICRSQCWGCSFPS